MSLKAQLSDIISGLIGKMISETLIGHIRNHGVDITKTEIYHVFQDLVERNGSFMEWVRQNKPHWLKYLRKIRRIRSVIEWKPNEYITQIIEIMQREGMPIGTKEVDWLLKTFEEIRREIWNE